MIKLVISGICGRMGKRIALLAQASKDFDIVGALESKDNPSIGKDIGEVLGAGNIGKKVESDFNNIATSSILIEFTTPQATMEHLGLAIKKKVGMVIGTTALSKEDMGKIKLASKDIPIVFSPNMSVGVNLLFRLVEDTSKALGKDYEVKMVEAHHTKKKDAPSGTGKILQEIVYKVRGKKVPIKSIREGDIVGDHTVIFETETEKLELTHHAKSRDIFAKGALDAAKFLSNKKTGLYSMQEVINGI